MHWETVRRRSSGAVVQLDFIDEGVVHEAVLVDDVIGLHRIVWRVWIGCCRWTLSVFVEDIIIIIIRNSYIAPNPT